MTEYVKLDPKTGRFLATPKGQKTQKMISMEKELGVSFEEDYKNQYLSGKLGQKRFSARWSCSRSLIFSSNLRRGRRSWIQMLELPKKNSELIMGNKGKLKLKCEACGEETISLDGAHWVEKAKRGLDGSSNIAKICPNCHRKLDRNDLKTIEAVRSALMYRVVNGIILKGGSKDVVSLELIEKCTPIIMHRRNLD